MEDFRRTKIICTLGPATDDENILRELINSGMNVARLNFSHGTYEDHQQKIDTVKRLRKELNKYVAILLDTKGPEIRTGLLEGDSVELVEDEEIILTTEECLGTNNRVSITFKDLPKQLKNGDRILVDDGLIGLEVIRVAGNDIHCLIKNGGTLCNRKSVNLPDIDVDMPYMSEKDRADIAFGVKNDVDFIAASFVRSKYDVIDVKKVLEEFGGENIHIISKIENREGVKNAEEILKYSNGIMIARGDMGVEVNMEDIPGIQKMLIKKCYNAGKVAITATQMLDSMIRNPRPTRAEVTDVANAIYDGTSAIMLSGETSVGKYPVEAFKTMDRVARKTESAIDYTEKFRKEDGGTLSVANAISHAACTTANDLNANAIVTVTKSGLTARMVSRFRPGCPIISTSTDEKVCRQLSLSWGVLPLISEEKQTSDDVLENSVDLAMKAGYIKNGDIVVLTGGFPVGISGTTNILKVHLVGHILCRGTGITDLGVCSTLCVAKDEKEAFDKFNNGDILVIHETSNNLLPLLKNASGIITEAGGYTSHAAIVGLTLDIPVIVGVTDAVKFLKNGTTVTLDCALGYVYNGNSKI